jgi:hypothetical protein
MMYLLVVLTFSSAYDKSPRAAVNDHFRALAECNTVADALNNELFPLDHEYLNRAVCIPSVANGAPHGQD